MPPSRARSSTSSGPLPAHLAPDGDGVGVNATIPSLGTDAAAEAARQSVESGFLTLKVKAGAERETEVLVERVRAIRDAVGPDILLRLDVNGAWDLATAEDRLEAIARFDIEFVEQPLAGDDIDGLAELRRRVRVPIAADEAASSVRAVRDLLACRRGRRTRHQARPGRWAGRGRRDRRARGGTRRAGRHQHAVRDRGRDRGLAGRGGRAARGLDRPMAGPARPRPGDRRPARPRPARRVTDRRRRPDARPGAGRGVAGSGSSWTTGRSSGSGWRRSGAR